MEYFDAKRNNDDPHILRKVIDDMLGERNESPEQQMWKAVIVMAVEDAYNLTGRTGFPFGVTRRCSECVPNKDRHTTQQCAQRYLASEQLDEDLTMLGIEPSYFRRKLKDAYDGRLLQGVQTTSLNGLRRSYSRAMSRV